MFFYVLIVMIGVVCGPLMRQVQAADRPNVIIVITDDQGYGDIAAHGNPIIKTPNMDRLHAQSVRLTDFHVDPTCAPTRSSVMSGRFSTRTGIWHTIMGRSLMNTKELTVAETFKAAGYRTGMFGKWHLGDNYPMRPQDQGFDHVVWHHGGGVTQGPDYWGNDYFDDTYEVDGKYHKFEGYCTDVWFGEALSYIKANRDKPFFVYLATNAPHGPYLVADKYADPYRKQGLTDTMARFYGMITNVDDNLGVFMQRLDDWQLAENTILIFMTDNGTAAGMRGNKTWRGFNAGMKGNKGSVFDGGHRVPFFIRWPAGGLIGGRDDNVLAAHIDVLPTLVDLAGIKKPDGPPLDGVSLAKRLLDPSMPMPDRQLVLHQQRVHTPIKWRNSLVFTERWRLVNKDQLYDIEADPGQNKDLAGQYPEVVKKLQGRFDKFWDSLQPVYNDYSRIGLGSDAQNPTTLMSHDWLVEDYKYSPWNQARVAEGLVGSGPWAVNVEREGEYEIALDRWPLYIDKPIGAKHAKLAIGDKTVDADVDPSAASAIFRLHLTPGPAMMQSWLTGEDDKVRGAYFVRVRRLP
ncbi:arylsulfatase [Planctomycetales bacterium ZRK34]|nr:arylsulfatase [Planctomycetales bacterium ZRK34]